MLRVENGVLIIDNTDYSEVDISDLRPNVDITLTVLEGAIEVEWPLDATYLAGDSAVFQTEFSDDKVRISNRSDGVSRVLLTYSAEAPIVTDIYSQPAIVPAAVSSQLDVTGEERIHIAPYEEEEAAPAPPAGDCVDIDVYPYGNSYINIAANWLSDAMDDGKFYEFIITTNSDLDNNPGSDDWIIWLQLAREGSDFYVTYDDDRDAPFPDTGSEMFEGLYGYLYDYDLDDFVAQGCVHANLHARPS